MLSDWETSHQIRNGWYEGSISQSNWKGVSPYERLHLIMVI